MKMRIKPTNSKATKMVRDIRRANRKLYSAEEKIRIVLEGLRGETTIAELWRGTYFGRGNSILAKRRLIKNKAIKQRRLQHRRIVA